MKQYKRSIAVKEEIDDKILNTLQCVFFCLIQKNCFVRLNLHMLTIQNGFKLLTV